MFGPDILVCPVLFADSRSRRVYLPEGEWVELDTGKIFSGGKVFEAAAPIESIPVYVKRHSAVLGQLA